MTGLFETHNVVVDGVCSPVRIGGAVTTPGEAVVFVHGNNAGADWTPLMTPVAEFARVIAPDMPGFGDADKPADWPYTVPGYADHLDGIIGQLGLHRVHLVAHDFGGPWALAWAADHLDAVASITLINTPVTIDHFAAKLWRTPVVGEAANRIIGARRPATAITRRLNPGLPAAALDEIVRHSTVPATRRAVLGLYRSTGSDALSAYAQRLKAFDGKVLIVWGEADKYIPRDQADQQHDIFRHAQIRPVPGAGHWPWLDQPDLVAGYLTEFLQ